MKIGMVIGSTTGNTEDAAELIRAELAGRVEEVHNVQGMELEDMTQYDVLLVGIPTWDIGQLQEDWERRLMDVANLDFEEKQVAFFGDGDQFGYPDNFQDAMGILRELFMACGAKADIGHWPADDYDYQESRGVLNGKFVGLALDDLQQPEKSEERIRGWVSQLLKELGVE
ncbi:MAG: flavodoxin [Pseudomonadota bacterium]